MVTAPGVAMDMLPPAPPPVEEAIVAPDTVMGPEDCRATVCGAPPPLFEVESTVELSSVSPDVPNKVILLKYAQADGTLFKTRLLDVIPGWHLRNLRGAGHDFSNF